MPNPPIIIIGAGIGGLSAAIHLAAAGHAVTVLEQNDQVGGKMGQFHADGFRWDTGPSIITMRPVFEDLFATAGRRLDDYLTLHPVDPLTRYFYPDGTIFDASTDPAIMAQRIADLNPADVAGYQRYLRYVETLHRITGPVFIYDQPPTLASFLKVSPFDALRVDGLRTMYQAITGFVQHPHLRQLLSRFATYTGSDPYRAPATLNVIGHVELNQGVWYPQGGIYAVARAYETLARELGVQIHLNTPVRQICLAGGRVSGVQLTSGETLPARAVVANLDVARVYQRLLPAEPRFQRHANRLLQEEPSCSGFVMLLGIQGSTPQLAHHNIFFNAHYPAEFDAIFKRRVPPDDPTIYITATSKATPADAPPGHENWFVLVNAPADDGTYHWPSHAHPYGDHVLDILAQRGLDVRNRIVSRHTLTPPDLERLTGGRGGALYGSSSNSRWAAFRRPHNRATTVPGLYFAGGTTHPGGGVPMVTLSGKVAAQLVLKDL